MFFLGLRKMAVFRIGLGLVLLYDLCDRASAFRIHFAADGVYPTTAPFPWLSLLHLSDSGFYQGLFFAIAIVAALAFTLGWRTKAAAIVAWLALVNIQHYAHLSRFSADDVLRLLLLWSIFLPLGARWSLDTRGKSPSAEANPLAVAAILAQVAAITFASGVHKVFDPMWAEGRGVELAMRAHGTQLGQTLAQTPAFAIVLNYLTIAVQLAAPLMLFVSNRMRAAGALILIAFQLALALCLNLGFFPFVTIVGLLLFLPERLFAEREREAPSRRAIACAIAVGVALPLVGQTRLAQFLGLEQNWSMFAPPPTHLPWIIVKLKAREGSEIDAATHESFVSWEAARDAGIPAGIRWATLAFRLPEAPEVAPRIGHSLCRAWREKSPMQASEVHLVVKDLRFKESPIVPTLLATVPCD